MPTAIITGANRGIGLEFCRQLKQRGYQVTALCRQASEELSKLGVHVREGFDVTDGDAIEAFARDLAPGSVDLLVNNAGILERTDLESLDVDVVASQFMVNALGPLRVTASLRQALAPRAKVVLVTSRMGSIADNGSGGSYGYRMSKAALNAAGVSLAHDLRPKGIAVAILHPGFVNTEMTGHGGQIDPPESVRGMLARIDELDLDNSGTFWHMNGEVLPW